MDLGGAEGEDLFNRTQRPEPAASKAKTAEAKPLSQTREKAPVSVPAETEATTPTEAAKPAGGKGTANAAAQGAKEAPKEAAKPPKKRTVTMRNADEEKRVKSLLDAIDFDTPELDNKPDEKSTVMSGDDVREDIAAELKFVQRDENALKRNEKRDGEPDATKLNDVEQGKARLLKMIRDARRR